MRSLALLPVVLLVTALQLVAAEYGSLTRVTLSGTIHTPGIEPQSSPTANGDFTVVRRTISSPLTNADILRAMVSRQLITTGKGYQIGLLKTAALDGAGEFIAYKPSNPAGSALRVPADILSLSVSVGPRQGTIRANTLKTTALNLNITSRDYATLSVLDYEGVSILTQRYSNSPKSKPPLNQVILLSARGDFQGVNAPEVTIPEQTGDGVGIITLELTGSKIVDLTPYGNVAPPNPTNNTTSSSITLDGGGTSGGTAVNGGSLTLGTVNNTGSGTVILTGNNTYTSGTTINGGNLTFGGGSNLGGNGTLSLNGGGDALGGNATLNLNSGNLGGTMSVVNIGQSNLTIDARNGNWPFGLIVDADGNITQLPTLTTTTSGNLIIITSTGSHTYARNANNVWAPVAP